MLGPVGAVVPIATRKLRDEGYWRRTNDRLRDLGDITVLVDPRLLRDARAGSRGRPYVTGLIEAGLLLKALSHASWRQVEGQLRGLCHTMGLARDTAPDYTTLSRRARHCHPVHMPRLQPGKGVVLVIDATGAHIDGRNGWSGDKPGGDQRRGTYLKVHLAIDANTGMIVDFDITRASGRGSGDAFVAPSLIERAYHVSHASRTHLAGGLGDGAYDSIKVYETMRRHGGRWYAPLPKRRASRGRHPDRDRHIDGEARLGEAYHDRLGYHQRSLVESTNAALKSTVGLASQARSFETQANEIAWQITAYSLHLERALADSS